MPRYRLDIEYDGALYAGWQAQPGLPTVQSAIETAITRFCGETVRIQGAGRTDAGVHALGQVAHVDLMRDWPMRTVFGAVNAHLRLAGDRVSITAVKKVPPSFDARFSAVARHYRYRIVNRRAPLALEAGRAWSVPVDLDADKMAVAAGRLLGRHDFTTFRSAHCQAKSPVRTLDRLDVRREGDLIEIAASARSFLHNQVRSMVGTLKRVGEGAWDVSRVAEALEARDRARCGALAPPEGLYLVRVDYPSGDEAQPQHLLKNDQDSERDGEQA